VSYSWPWALLALLILPLVLAAWWLARRRRKRATVRVTSIALVRIAVPGRSRWRRRIPAALLAVGLAVLAVGAARPQAIVPVASSSATIMLAGPRSGIVDFSGSAVVLVPPTTNTQQLLNALGGLMVGGATAIGEAILSSLDAIAQVDPSVAPTGATVKRNFGAGYADDVVVVLTDGSSNRGVAPPVAAREAAARGVRVFTIGYGTSNPTQLACNSTQFGGFGGGIGGGGFGGGGGGGNPFQADYSALMQISKTTGGTFYRAQDASQLSSALAKLPAAFTIVHKQVDIAAAFAALGGLLIAVAVALSLGWNRAISRPRVTSS
jgi:Ca-activated chloride channel family protein